MSKSYLETIALALLADAALPPPKREFRFSDKGKWRFDFCWVDKMLALEIDGGIYMPKSGHNTGKEITSNIEKMNEAIMLGYKVIRATRLHLENGQMLYWIKRIYYNS